MRLKQTFYFLLCSFYFASVTFAQEEQKSSAEEFGSAPFESYGDFGDQTDDEEEDTLFFQYGRFFGVSVGVGLENATGNRGSLFGSGLPLIDLKIHAWLDFQFAVNINFYTVSHDYDSFAFGQTSTTIRRLGVDLKYYFDVSDATAAITFANPNLTLGVGTFRKTESRQASGSSVISSDIDNTFGLSLGAGLEFPIKLKKVYFAIEGKTHFPKFKDYNTTNYQCTSGNTQCDNIPDQKGIFYTAVGQFLFTW